MLSSNKGEKELLFELIEKFLDPESKNEYLTRLKDLVLKDKEDPPKFYHASTSISCIFDKYPSPNIFKQITRKDLQTDVNELKVQVRVLQDDVLNLKTKDLEIEAKIALIETKEIIPLYIP